MSIVSLLVAMVKPPPPYCNSKGGPSSHVGREGPDYLATLGRIGTVCVGAKIDVGSGMRRASGFEVQQICKQIGRASWAPNKACMDSSRK